MRRETQNILLVLLGGALLKISFTGTFLRYVKPSHKWLLIIAGAVMVGLALVSIGRDLVRNSRSNGNHGDGEGHEHAARSAWLLLLPVLAVFLVAPPALGADSVQRSGASNRSAAAGDGSALFPPLPVGEVLDLPLTDFASRAAWDTGNSLNDRAVRLTGFVVHDGGVTYLARLAIACCAADAFPVKVKLEDGAGAGSMANDTWVETVVTVRPGTATRASDYVPSATVSSIEEINQPEDPYEH